MARKPKAFLYRDRKGEWRWAIRAANGNKLSNGGESYRRKIDCLRMLWKAMDGFGCDCYEERKP